MFSIGGPQPLTRELACAAYTLQQLMRQWEGVATVPVNFRSSPHPGMHRGVSCRREGRGRLGCPSYVQFMYRNYLQGIYKGSRSSPQWGLEACRCRAGAGGTVPVTCSKFRAKRPHPLAGPDINTLGEGRESSKKTRNGKAGHNTPRPSKVRSENLHT